MLIQLLSNLHQHLVGHVAHDLDSLADAVSADHIDHHGSACNVEQSLHLSYLDIVIDGNLDQYGVDRTDCQDDEHQYQNDQYLFCIFKHVGEQRRMVTYLRTCLVCSSSLKLLIGIISLLMSRLPGHIPFVLLAVCPVIAAF